MQCPPMTDRGRAKEIIVKIELRISNSNARTWAWLLRERYGRNKNTGLPTLVKLAVAEIIGDQAKKTLIDLDTEKVEVAR